MRDLPGAVVGGAAKAHPIHSNTATAARAESFFIARPRCLQEPGELYFDPKDWGSLVAPRSRDAHVERADPFGAIGDPVDIRHRPAARDDRVAAVVAGVPAAGAGEPVDGVDRAVGAHGVV